MNRILASLALFAVLSAGAAAQAPMPGTVPQPGSGQPFDYSTAQEQPQAAQVMPPAMTQPGVQIPFPNFGIDPECARQAGGPTAGRVNEFSFRSCREQEFRAHDVLLANWGAIPTQIILGCMSIARGTGFGSYAILATCISPQFPLP